MNEVFDLKKYILNLLVIPMREVKISLSDQLIQVSHHCFVFINEEACYVHLIIHDNTLFLTDQNVLFLNNLLQEIILPLNNKDQDFFKCNLINISTFINYSDKNYQSFILSESLH